MSKQDLENQDAAQETSAESQPTVTSIPNGWATSPVELLTLNVNDHTEKKNNLTYLSWAWAWQEALKADPTTNFMVHMFDGKPYMNINGSAMVWVTVTMFNKAMTCFLPVMDYKNKCIADPDAFEVNKTIMRCLTKALALHGLGLYIYAGEDLPEGEEKTPLKPTPKAAKTPDAQDAANDLASLELFVNGVKDFIGFSKTEADLVSFWKNNQEQLDELKAALPDRFKEVVELFKQAKAKVKESADE